MERQIGASSALIWLVVQSVMVKKMQATVSLPLCLGRGIQAEIYFTYGVI